MIREGRVRCLAFLLIFSNCFLRFVQQPVKEKSEMKIQMKTLLKTLKSNFFLVLLALFIGVSFLRIHLSFDGDTVDALLYMERMKPVAFYFEDQKHLKTEYGDDHRIWKLGEHGFDFLFSQLKQDGWKHDELLDMKMWGNVRILYGTNYPPFTVKYMQKHSAETGKAANRLVWVHKLKNTGLFMGISFLLIIAQVIYDKRRSSQKYDKHRIDEDARRRLCVLFSRLERQPLSGGH